MTITVYDLRPYKKNYPVLSCIDKRTKKVIVTVATKMGRFTTEETGKGMLL